MRPPLTRPGHLADVYHDLNKKQQDLERMLNLANTEPNIDHTKKHTTTAAGDKRKLRGIPCIANGVPGTQPGTDPLQETIRLDTHRNQRLH